MNISESLHIIKEALNSGELLLAKNEQELAFLDEWLNFVFEDDSTTEELVATNQNLSTVATPINSSNENVTQIEERQQFQAQNFSSVKERIDNCHLCNAACAKKYPVGSGENKVMIVMNSPNGFTQRERELFRQESKGMLINMMKAIKLDLSRCYTTNLIKCDSQNPLMRPSLMYKNCLLILEEEIKELNPKYIVVMGDLIPLQKIINKIPKIGWFNIDHPLTLAKNPTLKRKSWETLQQLRKELDSE